ncbi:hypothetical protein NP493_527g02009 [Ridgeia piscesae]|uniref:Uncharacterized protein n=1 Tax=Ridgeia piscesae TaxID=27915 RepID=A0AAD9KWU1_RIDPI|nr:hypothetical protein NP493_527g02009 [Ridgeia piscesae]
MANVKVPRHYNRDHVTATYRTGHTRGQKCLYASTSMPLETTGYRLYTYTCVAATTVTKHLPTNSNSTCERRHSANPTEPLSRVHRSPGFHLRMTTPTFSTSPSGRRYNQPALCLANSTDCYPSSTRCSARCRPSSCPA